jgi:hypothetical protein
MMVDSKVRSYCADNLREALGELEAINKMVRSTAELDEQEYKTRMARLYGCINVAWNCRNEPWIEVEAEIHDQNNGFAMYPEDLEPDDPPYFMLEAEQATEMLRGKEVAKVLCLGKKEILIVFADGTRLFVDDGSGEIEMSITADNVEAPDD